MVKSQARRLVPGSNLSELPQAFSSVSCTRSSASCMEPESEAAKARRLGISRISPSLKSSVLRSRASASVWFAGAISLGLIARHSSCTLLGRLKLREQHEKLVGHGRVHDVVVMGLEGAAYGFLHLRI